MAFKLSTVEDSVRTIPQLDLLEDIQSAEDLHDSMEALYGASYELTQCEKALENIRIAVNLINEQCPKGEISVEVFKLLNDDGGLSDAMEAFQTKNPIVALEGAEGGIVTKFVEVLKKIWEKLKQFFRDVARKFTANFQNPVFIGYVESFNKTNDFLSGDWKICTDELNKLKPIDPDFIKDVRILLSDRQFYGMWENYAKQVSAIANKVYNKKPDAPGSEFEAVHNELKGVFDKIMKDIVAKCKPVFNVSERSIDLENGAVKFSFKFAFSDFVPSDINRNIYSGEVKDAKAYAMEVRNISKQIGAISKAHSGCLSSIERSVKETEVMFDTWASLTKDYKGFGSGTGTNPASGDERLDEHKRALLSGITNFMMSITTTYCQIVKLGQRCLGESTWKMNKAIKATIDRRVIK